jgi:hypothetical protein
MNNEETMPRCKDAVIADQALDFLFAWLGSKHFKSPCKLDELKVPELERFFKCDDESRQILRAVLNWLQKENYLRKEQKRKPGKRRSKEYSYAEHRRAERALNCGWCGWLEKGTEKRYRTVLGQHKYLEWRYMVVQDNLFALFEEQFGLPNGCTSTEFARSHGIPTKFAKAWVRNLLERELVRLVFVRGKQVVRVL